MTIYHIGNLAKDRIKDAELSRIADELWELAMRKQVHLVQRRISEGVFAYVFENSPND